MRKLTLGMFPSRIRKHCHQLVQGSKSQSGQVEIYSLSFKKNLSERKKKRKKKKEKEKRKKKKEKEKRKKEKRKKKKRKKKKEKRKKKYLISNFALLRGSLVLKHHKYITFSSSMVKKRDWWHINLINLICF